MIQHVVIVRIELIYQFALDEAPQLVARSHRTTKCFYLVRNTKRCSTSRRFENVASKPILLVMHHYTSVPHALHIHASKQWGKPLHLTLRNIVSIQLHSGGLSAQD